jgi:methionine-rich copper-binding protein CopC
MYFMYYQTGGGIIKRKLFLSVIMLFSIALILNVSTSAAANVTSTNPSPKVTSVDPANNSIILKSKTIKIKFNKAIKAGTHSITLKNSAGTVIKTKKSISGKVLSVIPVKALPTGVKYKLILSIGSVKDLSGHPNSYFSTCFTVSPITLAQMKDGVARAQKFYNKNYRLPNSVSYGTKKIPIAQFKKIIATQGLKINQITVNGLSAAACRPIYITSDNINSQTIDNERINNIISILKSAGLSAYNMGLGPNTHINVLTSGKVPYNSLVVDIYGGADAGIINEMGTAYYKSIKGARSVFSVFLPPAADITGLAFLPRAHDDNYDPASFTGLAHPDQFLIQNGYNYIYSGSVTAIVDAIIYQATH